MSNDSNCFFLCFNKRLLTSIQHWLLLLRWMFIVIKILTGVSCYFLEYGALGVLLDCLTIANQRFEEALVLKDLSIILVGVPFAFAYLLEQSYFKRQVLNVYSNVQCWSAFSILEQLLGGIRFIWKLQLFWKGSSLNAINISEIIIIASVNVSYIWLKIEKFFDSLR